MTRIDNEPCVTSAAHATCIQSVMLLALTIGASSDPKGVLTTLLLLLPSVTQSCVATRSTQMNRITHTKHITWIVMLT